MDKADKYRLWMQHCYVLFKDGWNFKIHAEMYTCKIRQDTVRMINCIGQCVGILAFLIWFNGHKMAVKP